MHAQKTDGFADPDACKTSQSRDVHQDMIVSRQSDAMTRKKRTPLTTDLRDHADAMEEIDSQSDVYSPSNSFASELVPVQEVGEESKLLTGVIDANVGPIINLIDQLRAVGIEKDIQIPQIAVMGDQSSGKSSVLEAISVRAVAMGGISPV